LESEIVGGQAIANGVVAVSSDTLYWFNTEGSLESRTSLSTLIAEEPIRSAQDIAFDGNRLYILTPTRCHIFKLELQNR
jgi:hypothetical protein